MQRFFTIRGRGFKAMQQLSKKQREVQAAENLPADAESAGVAAGTWRSLKRRKSFRSSQSRSRCWSQAMMRTLMNSPPKGGGASGPLSPTRCWAIATGSSPSGCMIAPKRETLPENFAEIPLRFISAKADKSLWHVVPVDFNSDAPKPGCQWKKHSLRAMSALRTLCKPR